MPARRQRNAAGVRRAGHGASPDDGRSRRAGLDEDGAGQPNGRDRIPDEAAGALPAQAAYAAYHRSRRGGHRQIPPRPGGRAACAHAGIYRHPGRHPGHRRRSPAAHHRGSRLAPARPARRRKRDSPPTGSGSASALEGSSFRIPPLPGQAAGPAAAARGRVDAGGDGQPRRTRRTGGVAGAASRNGSPQAAGPAGRRGHALGKL